MMRRKAIEKALNELTQAYVEALMEIENTFGVQMLSETKVELETEEGYLWTVRVDKVKQ
jgi:hypothetical protein